MTSIHRPPLPILHFVLTTFRWHNALLLSLVLRPKPSTLCQCIHNPSTNTSTNTSQTHQYTHHSNPNPNPHSSSSSSPT
ncbi:hypothetical protein KC19_12G119000 [Ceratodon purpureus]|uniref:Uncharacterized protein n=1 Tax=Ceratodon purpureus TaxID=3225 RepID=A0A8T0G6B3_CERPU|nr:hypothetical protein KC19_12G119000 [Ceratodon purpureus]